MLKFFEIIFLCICSLEVKNGWCDVLDVIFNSLTPGPQRIPGIQHLDDHVTAVNHLKIEQIIRILIS